MLSTEDLQVLLPEKECANPTPRGTMGSIRREEARPAPADALANPADTDVILSKRHLKGENDGTVRA